MPEGRESVNALLGMRAIFCTGQNLLNLTTQMLIRRNIPDNLISCPHCLTLQSASEWVTCDGDTIPITNEGRGATMWECLLFNYDRNGDLKRVRAGAAGCFQWDATAYGGALDCW